VTVTLDGSTSIEPNDGFSIDQYSWDLDNNGTYDVTLGSPTYDWHIDTPGGYTVKLQVHSTSGLTATTSVHVDAGDNPPDPVIDGPADGGDAHTPTWSVGDRIAYSGHATDAEDGTFAGKDLHWTLLIEHCTGGDPTKCHEHTVETATGLSGQFTAPDHEYPSHLRIRLTVTDSAGASASTSVDIWPLTSIITVKSIPSGARIAVDSDISAAPWVSTVIRGGSASVSAPLAWRISDERYRFSTWTDSHIRVRTVVASSDRTLTASYVPDQPEACASVTTPEPKATPILQRSSGNNDVDWFEFHIARKRHVVVRLTDVPVSLRLDLYGACGSRITGSDKPGKQSETITSTLGAGYYRVRVKSPSNGWSGSPYTLTFTASRP
jgi:hypothetical protein